ncbi:galactosylceramide sulfotransferase-like [Clavelina lepadiformis]|uniref:galactosylceramide sulfotransferase-like n=1 Tax=Clavelina lepadiformis TaxID=159417 RepID=UPI0040425F48
MCAAYRFTSLKKQLKNNATRTNRCQRKTNISFIKTHKTASTAVQNVLLRYGLHNNLKIAFPVNTHDFNYPGFFSNTSVAKHGPNPYNIICHHMRMRYAATKSIMPKDSPFVTIVREPGQLFESTFDYFWPIVPSFQRVPHHNKTSIEDWLDQAADHMHAAGPSTYAHFGKNPTFFDLGYNNMKNHEQHIQEALTELSKIFDLVMVADYFDESIVLFADLMCWDLEDVACLSLNARSHDNDSEAKTRRARIREKARRWNKADAALFDYFNATLWKKIEMFGLKKMESAISKLKEIRNNLTDICIEGGGIVDSENISDLDFKKTIFKPRGVSVASYNLKPGAEKLAICRELIASENTFSRQVFNTQRDRLLPRTSKYGISQTFFLKLLTLTSILLIGKLICFKFYQITSRCVFCHGK